LSIKYHYYIIIVINISESMSRYKHLSGFEAMAIGAADAPLGPDAVRAAFAKAAVSQEEQLPAVLLVEIPQVRQARRFPHTFLTKQRDDLPRQAWDRRVRETVLKTAGAFCAAPQWWRDDELRRPGRDAFHLHRSENASLLRCHCMLETIILPRQARDKHRESTQTRDALHLHRIRSGVAHGWGEALGGTAGATVKSIWPSTGRFSVSAPPISRFEKIRMPDLDRSFAKPNLRLLLLLLFAATTGLWWSELR
jgi:hypothetical protein